MAENKPQKPLTRATVSRWTLLMRRSARPWRAWTRHTFSREGLFGSIRTFLWVVPLTLLIWVYAEREQLETVPGAIKIEARNSDAAPREVTLMTTVVNVAMTGPHVGIDRVKKELGHSLLLDISTNLPGRTRIPTSSLLANNPLFVQNGVTLTSLLPAEIEVKVDPIETHSFEVQPPPKERERLESVTFVPATIEVSAPQSYFLEHPDRIAVAELGLGESDAVGSLDKSVKVVPQWPGTRVVVVPATVKANAVVKQQDQQGTVSMPVWIEVPAASFWDKYKVDFNVEATTVEVPTIKDVLVVGPPDVIKRINEPSETPRAILDIDERNVPELKILSPLGKIYTGKLRFELPDKVKVAPVDAGRTIRFKIVERKAAE